ncbi:hypothetical protein B296_00002664 [Ensete ventricosum]|uniref:Uncharacterized protein n=1 Tax=Ensete ventricosum TaxID=4639 RepID=A0A426ZJ76_ENSVE|nr:hypothetical protein B296_00002664 [Ensete ventricosum]
MHRPYRSVRQTLYYTCKQNSPYRSVPAYQVYLCTVWYPVSSLSPRSFSPHGEKESLTDDSLPADVDRSWGNRGIAAGEVFFSLFFFSSFLFLPKSTVDGRNQPSTAEIDCRRTILVVPPGSGRSVYRLAGIPVCIAWYGALPLESRFVISTCTA